MGRAVLCLSPSSLAQMRPRDPWPSTAHENNLAAPRPDTLTWSVAQARFFLCWDVTRPDFHMPSWVAGFVTQIYVQ